MEPPKETGRVEGFSDAVFAIAITLLALDLPVPSPASGGHFGNMADLWPEYLSFFSSFGNIAILWIYHHKLFTIIRRADHMLLLLNCLLLLGVTTIPYSNRVLAAYADTPGLKGAAMVHAGIFTMTAVFFKVLWQYSSDHGRLLDPRVSSDTVRLINRNTTIAPLLYAGSFLLASTDALASSVANVVLAIFFALPKWRDPNLPGT